MLRDMIYTKEFYDACFLIAGRREDGSEEETAGAGAGVAFGNAVGYASTEGEETRDETQEEEGDEGDKRDEDEGDDEDDDMGDDDEGDEDEDEGGKRGRKRARE